MPYGLLYNGTIDNGVMNRHRSSVIQGLCAGYGVLFLPVNPPTSEKKHIPVATEASPMLEYKTDTRSARTEDGSADLSPEELLKQRRAFYYDLVDKVFGPDEPQGRNKARKELAGLTLREVLGTYAAMRTSREI